MSEALITQAHERSPNFKNPEWVRADLLHLPFPNATFDAVILLWHTICELREHQEALLRELYRVLKTGGIFILDFPDRAVHTEIDAEGVYTTQTQFGKYVGLVPDIKDILDTLKILGFKTIAYKRVTWGIKKFVVVARTT